MATGPIIIPVDGTNIKIIDPNPTNKNINLEDLVIYVKLVAKTKGRSIITEQADESVVIDQQFVNVRSETNFTYPTNSDGTFSPLNTDWTKIGGGTLGTGEDVGGFGITNIDIDFKSSFMPQIVIDFVDIRGATLFEQGACSPYAAFFHLPYPVFDLTVKGFYGKPVKYNLALTKFNTKFNSETGNFESKAEFVGYTYAFLADIPMGYVMAASYMPEGRTKLIDKYGKTLDKLKEEDKNVLTDKEGLATGLPEICPDGEGGVNCGPITIRDLLHRIKELEKLTPIIAQSKQMQEILNLNKLSGLVKDLTSIVNQTISNPNSKSTKGLEQLGFEIVPSENISINVVNNVQKRTSRTKLVKEVPFNPQVKEPNEIIEARNIIKNHYGDNDDTFSNSQLQIQIREINRVAKENNIDFSIEIRKPEIISGIKGLGYGTLPIDNAGIKTYYIDLGVSVLGTVTNKISEIEKLVKSKKESLKTEVNRIVFGELGFKPTIRNVFAIILCNVEVFLDTLVEASSLAEKAHENNDDVEAFADDVSRNIVGLSDNPSKDPKTGKSNEKIYPWPTYYELKRNQDGTDSDKETYPGVQSQFFNWEEVKYVEKFITAFSDLKKDLEILSGDVEDRPGFDNFIPLLAFETQAFGGELRANRWYRNTDYDDPNEILKVMGESAFLIGDYSFLNKLTAWKSQMGFDKSWNASQGPFKFFQGLPATPTQITGPSLDRGVPKNDATKSLNWGSPWVNGKVGSIPKGMKLSVMTNLDLMNRSGKVDALNFLSTSTNSKIINSLVQKFKDPASTPQTIVNEIKKLLEDKVKVEQFDDWAKRAATETNNTGNPQTKDYITKQDDLWESVGLITKNGYKVGKDWKYHKDSNVLSYKGAIRFGGGENGGTVHPNPNENEYGGIRLLGGNSLSELKNRSIDLKAEVLDKRGTELYQEYEKLGYTGDDGNGINLTLKGIPSVDDDAWTFGGEVSYVFSNKFKVKMDPNTGLPTPDLEDDETDGMIPFVKSNFKGGGSDDILYDMGAISRITGVDPTIMAGVLGDWDYVDFQNQGYSSDNTDNSQVVLGVTIPDIDNHKDALIQTPIWINNYPIGKQNIQISGSVNKNPTISTNGKSGLNNHPSAEKYLPLSYIWLLSHGSPRTNTGYYFFHDYELSPANIFNFSPMIAKLPKGYPLLMGAILWRLKESGELVVSDGIIPEFSGNDPVWFNMSVFSEGTNNPYLDCPSWKLPFSFDGFKGTTKSFKEFLTGQVTGSQFLGARNSRNKITHRLQLATSDTPINYYEPKRFAKEFMFLPTKFKERLIQYFVDWTDNTFKGKLPEIDPLNFPDNATTWFPLQGSPIYNSGWVEYSGNGPKITKGNIGASEFLKLYTVD